MTKSSGILLLVIILLLGICSFLYKRINDLSSISIVDEHFEAPVLKNNSDKGYLEKARQLNVFTSEHKMNTSICFLVNMKKSSNLFRFYVYDLKNEKVLYKGLVANGKYEDKDPSQIKFSNEPGSGCTSLGRYKIGYKYNGDYGKAYKLYGLDSSNSNAFERSIVLHSFKYIPDKESDVLTSLSYGCPMVSQHFLDVLSKIIDTARSPVALEIFYE